MTVALILFLGGLVMVSLVFYWLRLRSPYETPRTLDSQRVLDDVPFAGSGDAVLIAREYGQLVYANAPARTWFELNGGDPHLEQFIRQVTPADNLLELLAHEGQSSFQLGRRWVEASSHRIPYGGEPHTVIVLRELTANTQNPDLLDLSDAMAIINQIGETVDASSGVEPTLQTLLSIIRQYVTFDVGEINLFDSQRHYLEPRGYLGEAAYLVSLAERGGFYQRGEGITGWIVRQNAPILLRTRDEVVAAQPKVMEFPLAAVVGVPLVMGSQLMGTLEVASLTDNGFNAADMALLQAISKAAALAIYNAEIYAEQVEKMNAITTLQQDVERDATDTQTERDSAPIYAALTRRVAELMNAEMSGVFIYDEARNLLVPELPFHGLPEALVRSLVIPLPKDSPQRDIFERQPYWISNDLADDSIMDALGFSAMVSIAGIKNTAWLPLQISGRRIGMLTLSNKRGGGFVHRDIQNLQAITAQAAIVVENLRLYARERRLDAELEGLREMTYAIGALTQESEFYSEITERIARLLGVEMCGVLLFDEDRRQLVSRLPFYGVPDALVENYVVPIDSGSAIEELWESESYWYSNRVQADTLVFAASLDDLARRAGVRQTLLVKLSTGGRDLGVVQVSNRLDGADFDDATARLLTIYATQAATMIENARLFSEVQRSSEEAQRLRRIAELAASIVSAENLEPLLAEIADFTQSPIVYVNILDAQGNLVTWPHWAYGVSMDEAVYQETHIRGFEHSVVVSRRPFYTNDLLNDPRVLPNYIAASKRFGLKSAAMVPLVVGERSIGELGISNRAQPYDNDDIETLLTIGAQIASALERFLLYEMTGQNLTRRMQELDAVSRVSNELTQTVDFDQIIDTIRREAVNATGAVGASFALLKPSERWEYADQPELARRIGALRSVLELTPLELAAIRQGAQSVVVNNYEQEKLEAVPPEAKSALAVSVLYAEQVIGVIHLYHTDSNRFDDRAASFLEVLAAKATLGYGNFIRFQEAQERSDRLRTRVDQLNRIFELGHMLPSTTKTDELLDAVAFSVQQSVGFDTVLILMADDRARAFYRSTQAGMPIDSFKRTQDQTISYAAITALFQDEYRISESYFFPVEQVDRWYHPEINALSTQFDGNRTLNLRDSSSWRDGDMLLVPLYGASGDLLGLISLDRPFNDQRPDRSVIEVLEIFAHQTATTLENARLYQSSQLSAQQEARFNAIASSLYQSLELDDIVRAGAMSASQLALYDRATIAVRNISRTSFDVYHIETRAGLVNITQETRDSLAGTAMGQVFSSGVEMRFDRTTPRESFTDVDAWLDAGESACVVMPLMTAEPIGVLHVGTLQADTSAFWNVIPTYQRIAQLLSGAIQNARLFDRALELQVLNESVIESIQQGIVVLDRTERVLALNSYMIRYGWDNGAIGQPIFAYRPQLELVLKDKVRETLRTGQVFEAINLTGTINGRDLVRNIYLYPLKSEDTVRGIVMLVEDVTERALLESQLAARAKQLESLTEISSRITSSLERDDVVQLALNEMRQLLHYDTMTLWRRNGSQMVLEGAQGPHTNPSDAGMVIRIGEYEVVKAMVDSQRVILGDESAERIAGGLYGSSFARSWLGVPLVNQGHVVGMITLAADSPALYTSRNDQNLAFTFATQVAIAMANAELFEQTFDRTNELGILLEAAQATSLERDLSQIFRIVVELMFNALEMDECAILIWDQVKDTLDVQIDMNRANDRANTLTEGATLNLKQHPAKRHALQEREVVLITLNDRETPYPEERAALEEAGFGARMLVPLVVREEAIGLIVLGQQQVSEMGISMQKIRLARALGSQVAIAIENARLSTSMSSMLDESMIVNDLASALSSTLNLDDVINIVRRQLPRVTQAQDMYLALLDPQTQMITFPMAVSAGKEVSIPPRPLGDDEVSFVLRRNRMLTIGADYFTAEEVRHSLKIHNGEGEYASYLAVPLAVGNQAFGVLALRDSKMSAFTMNHQRVLTTVAAQLSAVIQNANLFNQVQSARQDLEQEVEERTRELENERDRIDTLYQITSELSRSLDMQRVQQRALGMVVKAVGGEDGVILSLDPLSDSLYPKATLNPAALLKYQEEGMIHPAVILGEWLIQNDNDVLVDDLYTFEHWDPTLEDAQRWRSAMAVVLESNENDPQGVMVIFSSRPNAFTEAEQRLLVAAANQVASATNNADLYNLIRDQADRLGGLLRTEQDEAEKNASILTSISDGVVLSDSDGKVILFNSAAEHILDVPRELALNQPMDKFKTLNDAPDILNWAERIRHYTEHHEDLGDRPIEERLFIGTRVIKGEYSPVYTGDRFLGIVSVFRDITKDVEVERLKGEFVSSVSHELRTPLTPIKGFTELLLMGAAGPVSDAQKRTLMMIKDNVDRLTVLVEDILDISKIDSGRDKLNVQPMNVQVMLQQVLGSVKSRTNHINREMVLSLEVKPDVPVIEADVAKFTRVMSNIIDNAFNYTPDGGSIEVRASYLPDTQRVLISVKDSGVGIAPEFREDVWKRFQRYEEHALQLDVAGTGLGLSIVKEMVEMHRGDVWFESELGQGTTFFVSLPIEQLSHNPIARATQTQTFKQVGTE